MVRQFTSSGGHAIALGETAAENQELCKRARQNDEWFHLDGAPSPHAILSLGGTAVTREEVHECAQLVKHFSKQRYVLCTSHFSSAVCVSDWNANRAGNAGMRGRRTSSTCQRSLSRRTAWKTSSARSR